MNRLAQAIRDATGNDIADHDIRHVVVLGDVATGRTSVAERIATALPDAAGIRLLISEGEMPSLSEKCGRLTVVPINLAPPANLVRDAVSGDFHTLVIGDTSDENAQTVLGAMGIGFHARCDDDTRRSRVIICHRGSSHPHRPDTFMDQVRAANQGTIAVVHTAIDRKTRVRSIASVEVL